MLNELRAVGLALAEAGIATARRHPDIKDVGNRATLRIRLRTDGSVWKVEPLDASQASRLWTLRDGQHNSFPYHQLKKALLHLDPEEPRLEVLRSKRSGEADRWASLLALAEGAELSGAILEGWPGGGWLRRLGERQTQLAALAGTPGESVLAAFQRFLRAAEHPAELLGSIREVLVSDMRRGRIDTELALVTGLLVDGGGAFYFDVDRDFERTAGDVRNVSEISRVLGGEAGPGAGGVCSLSGLRAPLVTDKFPQPNLPVLGQTYLFARNKDAPTNARYGRIGTDAVAISRDEASALQAALEAVTRDEWEGRTWRSIPGERPKQTDLFIAFVPGGDDIALASLLSESVEPVPGAEDRFASFAERLTQAFKGKLRERADQRLSLLVLRRLDPANRKAVYTESLTVADLEEAARRWSAACGNVPPSVRLPLPSGRGEPIRQTAPRDIAPLSLIPLTRRLFIRGGTQVQEVVGRTADEAMRLFLGSDAAAAPLARLLLRFVLRSRGSLLEGVGHAVSRGIEQLKAYDRQEALDTVTLLGLLLHRLGRTREVYMEEIAFKLGRLLAGADELHAGYNASERGGAMLPPRLMGNAVLPMAQSNPVQALAVMVTRWPVYEGWARRKASQWSFPERFRNKRRSEIAPKDLAEYDRARTISSGLWAVRRLRPLAAELHSGLATVEVNDRFRAELLLGYMAGPPRTDGEGSKDPEKPTALQQGDE